MLYLSICSLVLGGTICLGKYIYFKGDCSSGPRIETASSVEAGIDDKPAEPVIPEFSRPASPHQWS